MVIARTPDSPSAFLILLIVLDQHDEEANDEHDARDYAIGHQVRGEPGFRERAFVRPCFGKMQLRAQVVACRPEGDERKHPGARLDLDRVAAPGTAPVSIAQAHVAAEMIGDQRVPGTDPLDLVLKLHEAQQCSRPTVYRQQKYV